MLYRGRAGTKGFTLIELAIVLGITGLLFTGLWRLLSNGNQQLRDQATASQQQQLITAINTYLATAHGQTWMAGNGSLTAGTVVSFALTLPPSANPAGSIGCVGVMAANTGDLCTILPPGFNSTTVNPYGQTYLIKVLNDGTVQGTAPQSYSFMILTTGGDNISDTDGGRISSMMGGDGGFIYSNNVCGSVPSVFNWACGAYGAWSQNIAVNYGLPVPASGGFVASRTYYSPTQSSIQPWLARLQMPGDTNFGYNTMSWDLFVSGSSAGGGWSPYNLNLVPATGLPAVAGATGANINMGGYQVGGVPGGTGASAEVAATAGGGAINLSGGTINMVNPGASLGGNTTNGALNLQGGIVNMVTQDPGPGITITTGGNLLNLQGGQISDTSTNRAMQLDTGVPLIGFSDFVQISTHCSFDGGVSGLTQSGTCDKGLTVSGDQSVVGRLTANSLYAQTFIYNSSDMRLKTDIHAMKDNLESVMKLKPVDFKFKSTGQEGLGVIAQDVEKVYPQLVSLKDDGMKAVNYEGLIAPLIGAVQELKQENNELRDELRAQAIRQNDLEQKLKDKSTSR